MNCKRRGEEIREEANRRATRAGENDGETRRRVRREGTEARQKIVVRLLNVEGLTEIKLRELEEKFFMNEEYNILCLVETHHKWGRLEIAEGLENFTAMRELRDKKGGGLQILMRKHEQVIMEERRCRSRDLLEIEGRCFGLRVRIILVYFDVNRGETGRERNDKIRREVEE